MSRGLICAVMGLSFLGLISGCTTTPPRTEEGKRALHEESRAAILRMDAKGPGLKDFLDKSYGYAVFPNVGKGAFIVGGATGRGEVYEQGRMVGFAEIGQATIGLQAGGQSFAELIVFQDPAAMDRFRKGDLEFAANASAVALDGGCGRSARYENGVAIFIIPNGGLMAEAAIGGQKFYYQNADRVGWAPPTESTASHTQSGDVMPQAPPIHANPSTTPTSTTNAAVNVQINK